MSDHLYHQALSANRKLLEENARLKAEVERLDNNCDYLDQKLDEEIDKSAMLCGQVERLRKAGDLLCFHYISLGRERWPDGPLPSSVKEWNAAKEGKSV